MLRKKLIKFSSTMEKLNIMSNIRKLMVKIFTFEFNLVYNIKLFNYVKCWEFGRNIDPHFLFFWGGGLGDLIFFSGSDL